MENIAILIPAQDNLTPQVYVKYVIHMRSILVGLMETFFVMPVILIVFLAKVQILLIAPKVY